MDTPTQNPAQSTEIVTMRTAAAIAKVTKQVNANLEKNTLHLPSDYSVENALRAAHLFMRQSDQFAAINACAEVSIVNALMEMVVQGLNVSKKQCYLIPYQTKLVCQRSYFGDIYLVEERILPGSRVYAEVVYEGDEFEYEICLGLKCITTHKQKPENIDPAKIKYVYCGVLGATGENLGAEVMTFDQVKKSWAKSKTYGNAKSPHAEQPDQMALRTVIRRRLKPIINSAGDKMLLESIRRTERESAEIDIDGDAEAYAHASEVDVDNVVDAEFSDQSAENGGELEEGQGEPKAPF